MKIYFDGGCKPNPGQMEIAIVATNGYKHWSKLHHGTNNQAEWLAFMAALGYAAAFDTPIEILGDSKLVVEQYNCRWKVNSPELKEFFTSSQLYKEAFPNITVKWIGRKENLAGLHIESLYK